MKKDLWKSIKNIIKESYYSLFGELHSILKIFQRIKYSKKSAFLMMLVKSSENKWRQIAKREKLSWKVVSPIITLKNRSILLTYSAS